MTTKKVNLTLGSAALVLLLYFAAIAVQGQRGLAKLRENLIAQGETLDWRMLGTNARPHQSNGMPEFIAAGQALPHMPGGLPLAPVARPGVQIVASRIEILPAEIYPRDGGAGRTWVSNIWFELEPNVNNFRPIWNRAIDATTNDVMLHDLDWSRGYFMSTPNIGSAKVVYSWFRTAVAYDLHTGEEALALSTTINACQIVRRSMGVPSGIGQLIQGVGLSFLQESVWLLLQHDDWTDEQLTELQNAVQSMSTAGAMLKSLELERAQCCQAWEQLITDPAMAESLLGIGGTSHTPENYLSAIGIRLWRLGVAHHDLGWYLQRFQGAIESARDAVEQKSFNRFSIDTAASSAITPPSRYILSKRVGWDHGLFVAGAFKWETWREIQIAAIALKRFNLRHGHFPDTLNDLVPNQLDKVPVDWMDGQPLRYRRNSSDRFQLWSVGKDGIDQGGDPRPSDPSHHPYWGNGRDYVWPPAASATETRKFETDSIAAWRKARAPAVP